ncbi:hypothetical protein ABZW18_31945 [Streptomyces sp. NPDC004647]|uniref:hypothetical protein n=1 Tax=Streptomyces sp. NPDC004647 TaxID=3154671 RepID=UPI0033B56BDE
MLVGLFIVGGGVNRALTGGGSSSATNSAPEYKLTVPKTVADGKYRLEQDLSSTMDKAMDGRQNGANEHDMKSSAGRYAAGADTLVVMGMYGRIDDPETARDSLLRGTARSEGGEVTVEPREITPTGSDESLKCQVMILDEGDGNAPMCVWADSGTVSAVVENSAENAAESPGSIDLEAFAQKVDGIRDEVRAPLG